MGISRIGGKLLPLNSLPILPCLHLRLEPPVLYRISSEERDHMLRSFLAVWRLLLKWKRMRTKTKMKKWDGKQGHLE